MCINSRTVLFSSAAIAAFGACMAGVPMAMATTTATPTTIISDTFPASQGVGAGSYLQGATPDVGPAGSTWTTHFYNSTTSVYSTPTSAQAPFINQIGSSGNYAAYFPNSSGGDVDAAIPFTPSGNGILTLTATLYYPGGDGWVALGFANSAATADPYGQSGPWAYLDAGGGLNPGGVIHGYVNSHTNTVTLTFNPVTLVETFSGPTLTSGTPVTLTETLTSAPTINSIFFAQRGISGGYFSNVTLTQGPEQAVPEPASWGLLGLGGVAGLMLLRRRKLA